MSKIMIRNKENPLSLSFLHYNSSFIILTYLARGKYIVDSIKTEPDRRIYQQVFNSPRLEQKKTKNINEIDMYT